MTKCPFCSEPVPDQATTCPACAEPLVVTNNERVWSPNAVNEIKSEKSTKKSNIQRSCLIILAVVLVSYGIYLAVEYRKFSRQLTENNGIKIGDRREEVKYRLGYPTSVLGGSVVDSFGGRSRQLLSVQAKENDVNKMPAGSKVEDFDEWMYDGVSLNYMTVAFNKSGTVESIKLLSLDKPGWGPVAGLYSDDTEETVLRLGEPSRQYFEGVSKTIEYDDLGLEITLSQGKAYMVQLKGVPRNSPAVFLRFIRQ